MPIQLPKARISAGSEPPVDPRGVDMDLVVVRPELQRDLLAGPPDDAPGPARRVAAAAGLQVRRYPAGRQFALHMGHHPGIAAGSVGELDDMADGRDRSRKAVSGSASLPLAGRGTGFNAGTLPTANSSAVRHSEVAE
ncbi:hypothetical protein ACIOMQ_28340 [Streptomyces sp. NPDC087845]|uniref:hypothetical protein n=1 Tax=Streptomyces sp. NPDC087845 TaxID=3365806 RepID=UPI0037FABE74